ncbi:MAG: hypothetical protein OEU36_22865, partial [Gammaproteobacteria bacterium]|nr:hypothetical protein [Gammaproteobacteria bacterium]
PRHGKSIIQCRNHGWAFDMDGALRSTPHWGGFREHHRDGFDPGCHGLKPVRCEQWRQWLFVNLDGNAPPFSDYLAPFSKHFAEYNLDALVHNETIPLEIRGNWKIVEENFLEVLHLPLVHARLSRYAPFQEHDIVVDDLCIGTVIERGLPESWSPTPLPRFAAIPKTERKAKNLALFPNFKIVIGPDHCCTMVEFPSGAALTRQRWDFYFVGEGATDSQYDASRREIIEFFRETNEEDVGIIETTQAGRSSPGYAGGVFSSVWEPAVHQFQRLVLRYIS